MRRLLAFQAAIITTLLLWAAPAAGAAGPAIPGGSFGGVGVTGPPGLPSSDHRYVTLSAENQTILERIDAHTGVVDRNRNFDGFWALPAVTLLGQASGLSADGSTLVLIKPDYRLRSEETTLLIRDAVSLRAIDRVDLDGRFSFDAISPDGSLLYLVQYPDPRDPLDYRVRAYDWQAGEFRPGKIVDPSEPDEQMSGQPISRATSLDGRWAYTLYGGGEEAFIHALDTEGETAACVDLHEINPNDVYTMRLDVDPASGVITVLDRRSPVAVVDPQTFEVSDPPPAEAPPATPDEDSGGTSWIGWAAVGGGLVLVGVLAVLLWRRRSQSDLDEVALERLVKIDTDERAHAEAEREPVR
jgi:hypothetical protein